MVVIRDTLLLGPSEVTLLMEQYPNCRVKQLTNSRHSIQRYRLVLENVDEDAYFNFLFDNWMAMSSSNFYSMVKNNPQFAEMIKAKIAQEK